MAHWILMPQLGNSMEEGLILQWHKAEGEMVRKGEPLLDIETDKASITVEAEADGVLHKIIAPANTTVSIRQPIAIVGEPGEDITPLLSATTNPKEASTNPPPPSEPSKTLSSQNGGQPNGRETAAPAASKEASLRISPRAQRLALANGVPIEALVGKGTGPEGRIIERDVKAYLATHPTSEAPRAPRFTPLAARMANELGIAPEDVAPSVGSARVRREDVLRHAGQTSPTPLAEPNESYSTVPLTGMRRRIAENMKRSAFSAPHVTLVTEVDMSACVELRNRLLPEIERLYGVRLSFTDILIKAVAKALEQHPRLNATLEGEEIRLHKAKNIGVAVALDEGLVVPVLKHVESLSLGQIASQMKPLIERVRSGKFTPEDLSGGTFSITNLGPFGVDIFNPILVPGQAAILGVGRIQEKPVVHDGAVTVRPLMHLCLSFDHRQVDGAPAALFLHHLCELLQAPFALLV